MEEKKYSRRIGDKKTKKAVHQKNNDKKFWVKKEGMEHSNLGHQKPGCRTIPLFYTFISKYFWYYPLYTNLRALIWKNKK